MTLIAESPKGSTCSNSSTSSVSSASPCSIIASPTSSSSAKAPPPDLLLPPMSSTPLASNGFTSSTNPFAQSNHQRQSSTSSMQSNDPLQSGSSSRHKSFLDPPSSSSNNLHSQPINGSTSNLSTNSSVTTTSRIHAFTDVSSVSTNVHHSKTASPHGIPTSTSSPSSDPPKMSRERTFESNGANGTNGTNTRVYTSGQQQSSSAHHNQQSSSSTLSSAPPSNNNNRVNGANSINLEQQTIDFKKQHQQQYPIINQQHQINSSTTNGVNYSGPRLQPCGGSHDNLLSERTSQRYQASLQGTSNNSNPPQGRLGPRSQTQILPGGAGYANQMRYIPAPPQITSVLRAPQQHGGTSNTKSSSIGRPSGPQGGQHSQTNGNTPSSVQSHQGSSGQSRLARPGPPAGPPPQGIRRVVRPPSASADTTAQSGRYNVSTSTVTGPGVHPGDHPPFHHQYASQNIQSQRSRTPDNFLENSDRSQNARTSQIKPPMMRSISNITDAQKESRRIQSMQNGFQSNISPPSSIGIPPPPHMGQRKIVPSFAPGSRQNVQGLSQQAEKQTDPNSVMNVNAHQQNGLPVNSMVQTANKISLHNSKVLPPPTQSSQKSYPGLHGTSSNQQHQMPLSSTNPFAQSPSITNNQSQHRASSHLAQQHHVQPQHLQTPPQQQQQASSSSSQQHHPPPPPHSSSQSSQQQHLTHLHQEKRQQSNSTSSVPAGTQSSLVSANAIPAMAMATASVQQINAVNGGKQAAAAALAALKPEKPPRRREPRRHTLAHGIEYGMLKRLKLLEEEREVLQQGLKAVERARDWYMKQIGCVQEKLHQTARFDGGPEYSSDTHEERLRFQIARILDVNQHLSALIESSEKNSFPLHMNLALLNINGNSHANVMKRLKEQNTHLVDQLQKKTDTISQLEREKASLVRELFAAKAQAQRGTPDNTLM